MIGVDPAPQRIPPRSFLKSRLLKISGVSLRMSIATVRLSKNVQSESSALEPSSVTIGEIGFGRRLNAMKHSRILGADPGAQ